METKYAVYNPMSGENVIFATKEEALETFWNTVVSFAMSHMYGTSYMTVEVHEDGTEVWRNDNNDEIQKPRTFSEIQDRIRLSRESAIENPTSVVTLP